MKKHASALFIVIKYKGPRHRQRQHQFGLLKIKNGFDECHILALKAAFTLVPSSSGFL